MRGPKKPGDIGDPVADNIRAEQNASASPSEREGKASHRRHLQEQGCVRCDESNPDNLELVHLPEPELAQSPPNPTAVVCDRHREEVIADAHDRAEKADEKERRRREWREEQS